MMALATLAGCDRHPSVVAARLSPADERVGSRPPASRQERVADAAPLLEPGQVAFVPLASATATVHPHGVVRELTNPNALVFNAGGTLFVVASRLEQPAGGDSGNNDLILAIRPDGHATRFAESGVQGYALTEDQSRVPVYNGFSSLTITPEGQLLALRNEVYPVMVSGQGEVRFLPFVIPPSGPSIRTFDDLGAPTLPNAEAWRITDIEPLSEGRIALAVGNPQVWYRFRPGGMLEKIGTPDELPVGARLSGANAGVALATDGYLYGIEKGKTPTEPDRLVRVGDPGQSSLRPTATQMVLADLPMKDTTGYLAAGPRGQIAFSAASGVYLAVSRKSSPAAR